MYKRIKRTETVAVLGNSYQVPILNLYELALQKKTVFIEILAGSDNLMLNYNAQEFCSYDDEP